MILKKLFSVLTTGTLLLSAFSGEALAAGKSANLTIESVGDQMKYNKSSLTVPENSNVTLTFVNKSSSLSHNWILVKSGTSDKVAMAGIGAGEAKNFLPAGDKNIIAFTPLAKPGKTVKVIFKAPKKGSYDFVCTSPGHNMMMKGTFVVK